MTIILGLVLFASTAMVIWASSCSINQDPHFMQLYNDHFVGEMTRLINEPQMLHRHIVGPGLDGNENYLNFNGVYKFTFKSCAVPSDPVHFHSVNISPDPIVYPGDLHLSFNVSVTEDIDKPLVVDTTLEKIVGTHFVTLPCRKNFGTCHYQDYCSNIKIGLTPCPPVFQSSNVPCNCPYVMADYAVDQAAFSLRHLDMPDYMTSGDYTLNVRASQSGKQVTCFDIGFSLQVN